MLSAPQLVKNRKFTKFAVSAVGGHIFKLILPTCVTFSCGKSHIKYMNTVSLFTFREPLPNKTQQQNQRKATQTIHVEKYIESNFPPGKKSYIKPCMVYICIYTISLLLS